jgi:hypothetical protein
MEPQRGLVNGLARYKPRWLAAGPRDSKSEACGPRPFRAFTSRNGHQERGYSRQSRHLTLDRPNSRKPVHRLVDRRDDRRRPNLGKHPANLVARILRNQPPRIDQHPSDRRKLALEQRTRLDRTIISTHGPHNAKRDARPTRELAKTNLNPLLARHASARVLATSPPTLKAKVIGRGKYFGDLAGCVAKPM